MRPKLKPCPLCASESIGIEAYDPYDGYMGDCSRERILCYDCGVSLHRKTLEEAAEAWNTRKCGAVVANISVPYLSDEELELIVDKALKRISERLGTDDE